MSNIADLRRFHFEMMRRATMKLRLAKAQESLQEKEPRIRMFVLAPSDAREEAGASVGLPTNLPKRH